jgi:hypothetical protein
LQKGIGKLYVFRESDYAKVAAYKRLIQQLKLINTEYVKCSPAVGGVGPAFMPSIGGIANIFLSSLPLFKTDTIISGEEFDIEEEAVWASLSASLAKKGISLGNPFASNFDFIDITNSGAVLVSELTKAEAKFALAGSCTGISVPKANIDATFTALKTELGLIVSPAALETNTATTTTTSAPPNTTVVEKVEKSPAVPKSPTNITFWDYMRTEVILNSMQANGIYWLKIKNAKSGGNLRIKSSPLIDIFRGGSSIRFSGGSIAYYYVFDNDGKIVDSSVVKSYVKYTRSSRL